MNLSTILIHVAHMFHYGKDVCPCFVCRRIRQLAEDEDLLSSSDPDMSPGGGMVDTTDLKSVASACEFESRPGHGSVVEFPVDTLASNPSALGREGSSPSGATNVRHKRRRRRS